MTDDMHYWVPAGPAARRPRRPGCPTSTTTGPDWPPGSASCSTGKRHAQTPASPMRRIIANIEVLDAPRAPIRRRAPRRVRRSTRVRGSMPSPTRIGSAPTSCSTSWPCRPPAALRIWPGRAIHTLRRVDGELRMAAKTVELVTASQPQPNLTFLL